MEIMVLTSQAVAKEDAGENLYARKLFPGRERARENCSLIVGEKAFRLSRSRRREVATAIVSSNRFFL